MPLKITPSEVATNTAVFDLLAANVVGSYAIFLIKLKTNPPAAFAVNIIVAEIIAYSVAPYISGGSYAAPSYALAQASIDPTAGNFTSGVTQVVEVLVDAKQNADKSTSFSGIYQGQEVITGFAAAGANEVELVSKFTATLKSGDTVDLSANFIGRTLNGSPIDAGQGFSLVFRQIGTTTLQVELEPAVVHVYPIVGGSKEYTDLTAYGPAAKFLIFEPRWCRTGIYVGYRINSSSDTGNSF